MCRGTLCFALDYADNIVLVYVWALTLVFNIRYAHLSEPEHVGWMVIIISTAVHILSPIIWCRVVRIEMAWIHFLYSFVCLCCSFAYMQDTASRMLLALLLGTNTALHWGLGTAIHRTVESRNAILTQSFMMSQEGAGGGLDRTGEVDL